MGVDEWRLGAELLAEQFSRSRAPQLRDSPIGSLSASGVSISQLGRSMLPPGFSAPLPGCSVVLRREGRGQEGVQESDSGQVLLPELGVQSTQVSF